MKTTDIEILIISALPPAMLDEFEQHFRVHKLWLHDNKTAYLAEHGQFIRGAVTRAASGISAEVINALPALEMISSFGVGLDAIDLDAAERRGIHVTNTPKVLNECVADTALALMLSVSRRICEADRYARAGAWLTSPFPAAMRMSGKICAIAGLGNIGYQVAKRAQGFGMAIHYYDPKPATEPGFTRFDTLTALAASCDFLVLTLPGGNKTRHIIDADVLGALGETGILINISRGSVVDTQALIHALADKRIYGAGLDVFEHEPEIPTELFAFDNVVLLPHIASNTTETRNDMANLTIDNIKGYFTDGSLKTPVIRSR